MAVITSSNTSTVKWTTFWVGMPLFGFGIPFDSQVAVFIGIIMMSASLFIPTKEQYAKFVEDMQTTNWRRDKKYLAWFTVFLTDIVITLALFSDYAPAISLLMIVLVLTVFISALPYE